MDGRNGRLGPPGGDIDLVSFVQLAAKLVERRREGGDEPKAKRV